MTIPVLMHKLFHDFKPPQIELNLNKTHFKVLLIIHIRQKPNITKVCRHMNMEKGSMTSVIDRLIELKLVMRKTNPEDRRMVNLLLTENGKQLVSDYLRRSHEHIKNKLTGLSVSDIEKFNCAIDDLYDITQKL